MRHATLTLATALLFTAGCSHRTAPAAPGATAPTAPSTTLFVERTAHQRQVAIYVDCPAKTDGAARAHAGALALSLRDLLRARGFDVRSAESAVPAGENGSAAGRLATALAAGSPAPERVRAVSYLHPNAPRLLFFVHLENAASDPTQAGKMQGPVLGGFLADSTDGAVVWSGRAAGRAALNDTELRQLAERFLKTLPPLPAS